MPDAKHYDIQFHIDQRNEKNATMTGKNKVLQKATWKKQMRF